ncbi:MAG: hypothetical protein R3181_15920 [Rubricoccaceae bacterium]|nr:hypothetical protein [Rubricoccaceae bacterium]
MTDRPAPPAAGVPYDIPPGGSLGLLALGYRGLVAWRAVRGTDWIEERKAEHEAALAAAEAERQTAEAEGEAPAADALPAAPALPEADALAATEVIVVSGLPRSGTSMLMQMLTAGGLRAFTDAARTADESNPRGYYEHERVKALAHDKTWVPEAHEHVVKVVAPLLPLLPKGPAYRVVLLERDLEEVIRSQAAMLERLERPAAASDALRAVYARQLKAARAWLDATPGADALALQHADVLADPAGAAARLNAFLGGGLDEDAMAAVVDPSLHRQRA